MAIQDGLSVHIFYSWQTDLPKGGNLNGIRNAIDAATLKLREKYPDVGIKFLLDEATRDTPGSPNVPQTIMEKIRCCDIFISDITTVNSDTELGRKMPNPNVMFELGYACAHINWGRIILLFNEAFGDLSDAPFDLDRQRISKYKLLEGDTYKHQFKNLTDLLTDAIDVILLHSPDKPYLTSAHSDQFILRSREIRYVTRLLELANVPVLLETADSLPSYVRAESMHFWEGFSAFYLYPLTKTKNKDLARLFEGIHENWGRLLSFGEYYSYRGLSGVYHLDSKLIKFDDLQKLIAEIEYLARGLVKNIDNLITYIHDNYIEIDLDDFARKWNSDRIAYQSSVSNPESLEN